MSAKIVFLLAFILSISFVYTQDLDPITSLFCPCDPPTVCVQGLCIDHSLNHLRKDAEWEVRVLSTNVLEPDFDDTLSNLENVLRGGEDNLWLHLHRDSAEVSTAELYVKIQDGATELSDLSGITVRYTINKVPISPWVPATDRFTIDINAPDFDDLVPYDGVHVVSCEIASTGSIPSEDFTAYSIFGHFRRPGFITSRYVPVGLDEPDYPDDGGATRNFYSPEVSYVNIDDRQFVGYPANPEVVPWQGIPLESDLYVENLSPRTPLFGGLQMWWADPAHYDFPFIRAFPPKHSEEHTGLRELHRHERFPVKDGPRGVGWMSTYVTGMIDSLGRFAFAETSGRVGYMYPDGEIKTIAGWVTDPNKDPVWYKKTTETVRVNQVLRGNWISGVRDGEQGGFHTALDVAVDPLNEDIMYVAAYEDHCIWKIEINDLATDDVDVSVFVGSVLHEAGAVDGNGHDARLNGPTSIVFDPLSDRMYVADQETGRIRVVTRNGDVTTLYGDNNVKVSGNILFPYAPPSVLGACTWYSQSCAYDNGAVEVGPGGTPDIYLPHTIRVDSKGNIILLEIGFGTIRQIDPSNGETKVLGRVDMKFREWTRGWAWMDVDRWGNSGGLDSIYWLKFVGEVFGASHGANRGDPGCTHMYKQITCADNGACDPDQRGACPDGTSTNMFSETYGWIPADNTDKKSYLVFNRDWAHPKYGPPKETNPPHYPWLVAVDPRGAVLFGGGGEHGIQRMRARRADDPIMIDESTSWDWYYNHWNGRNIFASGSPKAIYGQGPLDYSIAPLNKYGWDGHNLLGFADTWGMIGADDETLLDTFEIPQIVRDNADSRKMVLVYLRGGTGSTGTTPIEPVPAITPQWNDPNVVNTDTSSTTSTTSSGTNTPSSTSNGGNSGTETSLGTETDNQETQSDNFGVTVIPGLVLLFISWLI